jgi:GTP cyclohydrolase IA
MTAPTPAAGAVRLLLIALGEDPNREGLRETPRRMAAMLQELCRKEPFNFTTFDSEGMSELIVQSHIPFSSLCEHHLLPFMGEAHVAYIPNGKIVGLSKLARAVGFCAKGLQNQERITTHVADMLEENLHPAGIGVVLRARHLCMEMRGVKAHDTWTTTSCLRGALLNEPSARAEFMGLVK